MELNNASSQTPVSRETAKESRQVSKARRKLEENMKGEKSKITPDAIKQMRQVMTNWQTRHKPEKIELTTNQVVTFSKTQNNYLHHLLNHLKAGNETKSHTTSLLGRVKTESEPEHG